MTTWSAAWVLLLALGLALEAGALIRRGDGDTLSEQVWALLRILWLRPILWAVWAWLTWHFFL